MIYPKLYKELIKQHIEIPDIEFQIVLSYDIKIIKKFIGDNKCE